MPSFKYHAKSQDGKMLQGKINAKDEDSVRRSLQETGYVVVEIKKAGFAGGMFGKKAKVKDISLFCRQFAIVLEAGVPVGTALDVLREQTVNPLMKETLTGIYEGIQKGISLSNSMKQYKNVFPDILISMVESGEVTGQLDRVFLKMAGHFEKEYALNKKVKGAMTYPVVVMVIAIAVVFILMVKVLPVFSGVLLDMNVELPAMTKLLIGTSDLFVKYWWAILGGIFAVVGAMRYFYRTPVGKRFFSMLTLKFPIIKGLTVAIMTARFTRTLSSLVASGVLLIQGLEVTQKVMGNTVVMEMMQSLIDDIKKGKGLSKPLKELNLFPPMLISMVRIGEESGELDMALEKCADYYDQEVEASIQQMTTMLEPLIIVILAGVIGSIVISILMPMMKIYETLSQ